MKDIVISLLLERGVTLDDMAELVVQLQKQYLQVTMDMARENIERVLEKREVQNALMTGIQLDILTERNLVEEPLSSILKRDDSLYGIDEILALSITNIYGSIGFTNFGYLDKVKPGIIGKLNDEKELQVNTFLDDLVAGLVAAACSRMAHSHYENKQ